MRFIPAEDNRRCPYLDGHRRRPRRPTPEELASIRADLKRQFDLTDEEADEAMRNITFYGAATTSGERPS